MKKVVSLMSFVALFVLSTVASADVFTAPAGSSISAKAVGQGSVQIDWSGFSVNKFVRFLKVEQASNGLWTAASNPPGKSIVLTNVCASNDKYQGDARFNVMDPSGRWLLVTPTGVTNTNTSGLIWNLHGSGQGYALEVSPQVLAQACGNFTAAR